MFLNIGNKRFVSLAALVLAPLVGFGQEIARIIEHPQNATVCVEEAATFTSETYRGIMGWRLNGTSHSQLPPEVETELIMEGMNTQNGTRWEMLSINYDEIFNGTRVQSVVVGDGSGNLANSSIAYLFYETNQQSPATGLTDTVNDTAIQIDWDASEAEVRTHYLISITDITETPDVVSSPQYVYFPESQNCQWYEFMVTRNFTQKLI